MREHPQQDSAQKYGGGYEQDASAEVGAYPETLTVSVRIGEPRASRYAAPSADQKKDFVYAALLYPDGTPSDDFVSGASDASGATITFFFQKPPLADGEKLTLEIFAFAQGTEEANFDRGNALLSGKESGLETEGTTLKIETLYLEQNASATNQKGTVSLKIKVPDGCTLEIDDTTNFTVMGTTPNFTIKQNGEGIQAKSYPLKFTLKKGGRTVSIVSDKINVRPEMITDRWLGLPAGEVDVDGAWVLSEAACDTLYVRGAGGWYDAADPGKTSYAADDGNMGSFLAPLETIHAAIEKTKDLNDSVTEYTIYIDGSFSLGAAADISGFTKNLTIKALSATATLDAGGNSRVMDIGQSAGANLELTLERLVLTGGSSAGGIQIGGGKVSLKDCEVKGNAGTGVSLLDGSASALTMAGGAIGGSDVADGNTGGGVYVGTGCAFTLESGTISGNEAAEHGGGVYVYDGGRFEMAGGAISANTATTGGGGVYVGTGGEFNMTGGTISKNAATSGGGVYVDADASGKGVFKVEGGCIGDDNYSTTNGNTADKGGGVYSAGMFTMGGVGICGNTGKNYGGGIYLASGTMTMAAGAIWNNTTNTSSGLGGGIYVDSGATLNMMGGMILGKTQESNGNKAYHGGGVYVNTSGRFNMSGSNTKILRNQAKGNGGGVYVESCGSFVMEGGIIGANIKNYTGNQANVGGGVYVVGEGLTFKMTGGYISGNKAIYDGGGVCVEPSSATASNTTEATFQMEGGEISGNTGYRHGGGVYASGTGYRFQMKGDSKISNNKTDDDGSSLGSSASVLCGGGGIYGNKAYITIESGTISGNKSARNGGGIFVTGSTIDISGGEISGNESGADYDGNGIYFTGSTINLIGAAKVADDNDVYCNGRLTVAGALTQDKVATITPWAYGSNSILLAGTGITITQEICDKFAVTPNPDGGGTWKIVPLSTGAAGMLQSN